MAERWYSVEAVEGKAFRAQLGLADAHFMVWLPVVIKTAVQPFQEQ